MKLDILILWREEKDRRFKLVTIEMIAMIQNFPVNSQFFSIWSSQANIEGPLFDLLWPYTIGKLSHSRMPQLFMPILPLKLRACGIALVNKTFFSWRSCEENWADRSLPWICKRNEKSASPTSCWTEHISRSWALGNKGLTSKSVSWTGPPRRFVIQTGQGLLVAPCWLLHQNPFCKGMQH
jgi:hypothetical protein